MATDIRGRLDSRDRWEIVAALVAALISVLVLCWAGRSTWFRRDVWEFFVDREAGSLESWLRPKSGHLQMATVGLHRLLYGAVGMDFWPWYYLPHVVGYAGFMFFVWRVLLRRGADRIWAFVLYLLLLFLGTGGFISSVAISLPIVVALLLVVAQRLDEESPPSVRDRVVVTAALLLMVVSGSTGVAGVAVCFLAAALTGVLRRWWWCFLPAVVVYLPWYLSYGSASAHGSIHWGAVLEVPGDVARLMGSTAGKLVGLGSFGVAGGAVVTVGLAAALGWVAWRRRLRRWDLILMGAVAAFLLMVTLVRGAGGSVSIEIGRYGYVLVVMLVPLLGPHLRFGERWPTQIRAGIVVVVMGALLVVNAMQRIEEVRAIENGSATGRLGIETVAQLIAAGEPAIDDLRLRNDLDIGTAGVLRVRDVRTLLGDGWVPDPAQQWGRTTAVRAALRLYPLKRVPAEIGEPPLAAATVAGGCAAVAQGGVLAATVARAGVFTIGSAGEERPAAVSLSWEDRFGVFETRLRVTGRQAVEAAAPPDGGAVLFIENRANRAIEVCGLEGTPGT